jgi:hypothetical protein
MTETAPTYEPDLIFSRVAEARANASRRCDGSQ